MHVYAMAIGLSFVLVAVGGVRSGIRTSFTSGAGPAFLLYAFEAVVIGGLGSLWGTFAGPSFLALRKPLARKSMRVWVCCSVIWYF